MEQNSVAEDEIDLIALVQTVWAGRRTVIKILIVFGLIGLFVAIFSPKEYTASTVMVPTVAKKGGVGGSLGGLAAMAGINLSGGSAEVIPPTLYPKIVKSLPFKKKLLETKINTSEREKPVSYQEYYTDVYSPGLLATLKKYTIGLPGVILGALRGNSAENATEQTVANLLVFITKEEKKVYGILDDNISLNVNDKEGYVELSASMPEAVPAAQLAEKAQALLQEYIIEFKSKKAKDQLRFVQERFKEKEKEFRKAEYALANFQDRNKNVISAKAKTIERQLQTRYNLAYNVYSELAKQIEQQKIQVKEDTPVFSIIEPVSVPTERSKPKRGMILIIWLFLGGVFGVGVVLGKEWLKSFRKK